MGTVMRLMGDALLRPTGFDGWYLKEFDFEAHDGQGELDVTPELGEAMIFPDMQAALAFYGRSPICQPLRPDGKPNRPLTATTWEFLPV